jgi:N-acetyl sugar amidotransferase
MDTTDPDVKFDEKGVCNHCKRYDEKAKGRLFVDDAGRQKLNKLINEIKNKGKNKKYDCVIGLSGGVDSTYVAYQVKKLGLKPLAVHFDNGWDTDIAKANIKRTLKKLEIDLFRYVVDWDEFKDLQLSFLKGSVPDAELPTDHGILAILYKVAIKKGVKFVFTGSNVTTEGIHPTKWGYGLWDWKYIKSVHRKFGSLKLRKFPHYSLVGLLNCVFLKRIRRIPVLNYVPYVKKDAMKIIEKELGWRNYGGKHRESIYTKFLQDYILPRKFSIDKRRAHLSSLVCSLQMTRDEALQEIKRNLYLDEGTLKADKEYVLRKLEISEREFESLMSLPIRSVRDYPSNYWLFPIGRKLSTEVEVFKFL